MLKHFQDCGVYAQEADNAECTLALLVPGCRNDRRPGIGNEMLDLAGHTGPHHFLRRQQRENGEKDDAAPRRHAAQFYDGTTRHSLKLSIIWHLARDLLLLRTGR